MTASAPTGRIGLARVDVLTSDAGPLRSSGGGSEAVLAGVALARELVSEPSDTLTPAGLRSPLAAAGRRRGGRSRC